MNQSKLIRKFILKQIVNHPADIVAITSTQFNVTRTTVHRHLNKLLRDNQVIKSGLTKDVRYYTTTVFNRSLNYKIIPGLSEYEVLKTGFEDIFKKLSENHKDIFIYGFTEIFNNAIDHSQGKKIIASTHYTKDQLVLSIEDDGIGIFKNIYDICKLDDMRESILQLTKGKITTDPIHHTGEGLFFTMRIFDVVEIKANNLCYLRDNSISDWCIKSETNMKKGSTVTMTLNATSTRNLMDLFNAYQNPETLAFDRTEIIVAMSNFGEETLISRSQAKRILRDLEKFQQITLDFTGIRLIGQGFVDEIFRVFINKNPGIKINYIHANKDIEFMMKRCL